jgi:hypothetical protein
VISDGRVAAARHDEMMNIPVVTDFTRVKSTLRDRRDALGSSSQAMRRLPTVATIAADFDSVYPSHA